MQKFMRSVKVKNILKRLNLLSILMVFSVVFCLLLPLSVQAENATSGTLGDNNGIKWTYDAGTKTLTVTGEDAGLEGYYDNHSMRSLFYDICSDVERIELRNCKIKKEASGLFAGLSKLKEITFSNFDTSEIVCTDRMFQDCSSLESLDLRCFDTSKVLDMSVMFERCSSLASLNISSFDTGKVQNMMAMFRGCNSLKSLDVSSFDTSNVISMESLFEDCGSLSTLDVSGFNTCNVKSMRVMFMGCKSLTSLDVSVFDTSKVKSLDMMFYNCENLTSLDLSKFDTGNVTNMSSMFRNCSNLTSLNLSKFDTGNVTNMGSMFRNCSNLTSLNLSKFDTSNVTNMSYMFSACSGLASLDLSNFDMSAVTEATQMFSFCQRLELLKTPKAMAENLSVNLPGEFTDSQKAVTSVMTAAFCNDTLMREVNPFADVPSGEWYYPYVKKAYDRGIMSGKGTANGGLIKFDPLAEMSRAEFVQILYAMEGKPAVTYSAIFSDVPNPAKDSSAWYANAVIWAAQNELVSGIGEGKFGVYGKITREQMALILYGYASKYKNYETDGRADVSGFADAAQIDGWAEEAMKWAVEYKIMSGTASNRLNPCGNTTRAEAATMLNAFIAYYEDK